MPIYRGTQRLKLMRRPAIISAAAAFSLTATDNATDTTGTTTITFGGKNFAIGAADSTRLIAACFASRDSVSTHIATAGGVVIGGVTATSAVTLIHPSGSADAVEIWYAAVPTGTTATVSITFTAANQRSGIQLYSIISPGVISPATGSGSAASGTVSSASPVIIPSGGAAVGVAISLAGGPATPTGSPAGFTNIDLNSNIAGAQEIWALHSNAGALTGSQTLSTTIASSGTLAAAFAAWGP